MFDLRIFFAVTSALWITGGCGQSLEVEDCTLADGRACAEQALVTAGSAAAMDEPATGARCDDPGDDHAPPSTCDLSIAFAPTAGAGGSGSFGGEGGVGSEPPPPPPCGCTRRPGEGNSFQCPRGTGASAVAKIGPKGGTVRLGGTASTQGVPVELRIPPNALDRSVAIRITETSIPPAGPLADWSPVYHFEPETLRFNVPVEVRIPWSNSLNEVSPGLAIYWSDDAASCALAPLADNYQNAGFNQGSVLNLGWAIVGAPRADACP
jgi:hypothetical protein